MKREHKITTEIPLPSGYTRLNYIQSTGTQYINTGILLSPTMEWYIEVEWNEFDSNNAFGYEDWQVQSNILRCNGLSNVLSIVYGDTNKWAAANATMLPNTKMKVLFQNGHQYVDGVEICQGVMTKTSTRGGFYYFADCNNNQVYFKCKKAKHYYSYFKDNGVKIREYIPALRTQNNKPGLYDIINNVFYVNSGAGEFQYA